jgi:hypothetical protein
MTYGRETRDTKKAVRERVMGKKTLSKAFHLFEKFKIPPETQTELPELKLCKTRKSCFTKKVTA